MDILVAKQETSMKQAASMLVSSLACTSNLKVETTYPTESSINFSGLHGSTFQKIKVLKTTGGRT
jgi:hypothetical protein